LIVRHRLAALAAVVVASLAIAGTTAAFDCIRVSSSLQGLQQSTRSGNWLLFDLSSAEGVQQTFANVGETVPSDTQAQCFVSAYATSRQPLYFALGIGVAGPNGVLAHRNTNTTGDGKGIDHFEESAILPAIFAAAEVCGIELSEE
jgi:hypothetical protein